jgi:hypothetical protein
MKMYNDSANAMKPDISLGEADLNDEQGTAALVMMIRENALLGARLSAFFEDTDLLRNIAKSANHFLVAIIEGENGIGYASIATKVDDELLGTTEVVTRDARVEVVNSLELQSTMEEVEPCRAVDIHGGAQHLLRKRFMHTQVGSRHGKMGQRDLHMQRSSDHVRDQDVGYPAAPVRNRAV